MTPCGNVYDTEARGEPTFLKYTSALHIEGDGIGYHSPKDII